MQPTVHVHTRMTLSCLTSFPLAASMAFILAAATAAAPVVVVSVSVATTSHLERRFFTGGSASSLQQMDTKVRVN